MVKWEHMEKPNTQRVLFYFEISILSKFSKTKFKKNI